MLTQALSLVARCHPDTTIAWLQPSRGTKLVPNGDGPKTYWLSRLPPFTRPKETAARSLPSLGNTRKRSPPAYRIKAFPYRQLWLHEKSSVRWHLVNVQIRFMSITICISYHEHAAK